MRPRPIGSSRSRADRSQACRAERTQTHPADACRAERTQTHPAEQSGACGSSRSQGALACRWRPGPLPNKAGHAGYRDRRAPRGLDRGRARFRTKRGMRIVTIVGRPWVSIRGRAPLPNQPVMPLLRTTPQENECLSVRPRTDLCALRADLELKTFPARQVGASAAVVPNLRVLQPACGAEGLGVTSVAGPGPACKRAAICSDPTRATRPRARGSRTLQT
jgi:hypothetical protein